MEKPNCPQLYPGCEDCPYIRKHWDRNLAQCPYYLGIDTYTLEQHHDHETMGQMFDNHKRTMRRREAIRELNLQRTSNPMSKRVPLEMQLRIPSLFDPSYHEQGLCEVTLTDVKVNYDGDIQFIEGQLHPFGVNVQAKYIRTPVYGKAVGKARSIMHASWVKAGTPGHIPVPKELILVLNADDQIVDIKCPVCRDTPCECSPETKQHKNE